MTRPRAVWMLCAAAMGLLVAARPQATVIVGVQMGSRVVLAADSSSIDETGTLTDARVCKLVAGEHHVFGLAGTTIGPSFNAFHLAAVAAHGAGSVTDANNRFTTSVRAPLTALVRDNVQHPEPVWSTIASPCRQQSTMLCGNLLHYVIAGRQVTRTQVALFTVNFRAPANPPVTLDQIALTFEFAPLDPPLGFEPTFARAPFAVGTYNAIAADLVPTLQFVRDPQEARAVLERLVSKQMKATPARTRGPIDVISIDGTAAPVWLAQKPECKADSDSSQ